MGTQTAAIVGLDELNHIIDQLHGRILTADSAKHRRRADLLNIAEATRIAGEVERQGFLRVAIIPVPTPAPDVTRRLSS